MSAPLDMLTKRLARIPVERNSHMEQLGYLRDEEAELSADLEALGLEEVQLIEAISTLRKLDHHDAADLISVEPS